MKFDFQSVKTRLVDTLRAKVSWAEILEDSTNHRLIDTAAEGISELGRYAEYLLRESKWSLARNRSSLVSQATVLGYRPHRKIGAIGNAQISVSKDTFSPLYQSWRVYAEDDIVRYNDKLYQSLVDSNFNNDPDTSPSSWQEISRNYPKRIGIPIYTQLSAKNGTPYTTVETKTLQPSQNYVDVKVVQGTYQSQTFTAQGDNFEEFIIQSENFDENYYEVYVNNQRWNEIDNIKRAEETDQNYQVFNFLDFSGVYFRFGNDITGKKLATGDTVTIRYIDTLGASGNITTVGLLSSVDDTLVDIDGKTVNLFAYNFNSIAGGKNEEDIESIRVNGVQTFQSGQNLIGKTDYEVFLRSNFDFVGNVICWGAFEQNVDENRDLWEYIPAQENLVYISAYTPGSQPLDITKNADGSPNDAYKIAIIKAINERKPPTDIVQFEPVQFIYMKFNVDLFVKDASYLLNEVIVKVRKSIEDQYSIDKLDFFQPLYETNYKRLIDSVDGVAHHKTYVSFYDATAFNPRSSNTEAFTVSGQLPLYPIEEGTVEVYRRDTSVQGSVLEKLAVDDEAGSFTAESGVTITGTSTINYTDGTYNVSFDFGTVPQGEEEKYDVQVHYQTSDLDLKPKRRNQVLYLKDTNNMTAQYVQE